MNGPQDLGGRAGFGPVAPEADEPLFHAGWEPRALALTLACGSLGHWTLDESRHARESLPARIYYGATYYEIWIRALEALLERHGEISTDELRSGTVLHPGLRADRALRPEAVEPMIARGTPVTREPASPARFAVGDRVRTLNIQPDTHTRLPGYAREKPGVIDAVRGAHVFPDTNAHGKGEQPQWLYTVLIEGHDLWGDAAEPGSSVSIDAWEPYLEAA